MSNVINLEDESSVLFKLNRNFSSPVDTVMGKIKSADRLMRFIGYKDSRVSILNSKGSYRSTYGEPIKLPNYWGIVTLFVWSRIVSDLEIRKALIDSGDTPIYNNIEIHLGNEVCKKSPYSKIIFNLRHIVSNVHVDEQSDAVLTYIKSHMHSKSTNLFNGSKFDIVYDILI